MCYLAEDLLQKLLGTSPIEIANIPGWNKKEELLTSWVPDSRGEIYANENGPKDLQDFRCTLIWLKLRWNTKWAWMFAGKGWKIQSKTNLHLDVETHTCWESRHVQIGCARMFSVVFPLGREFALSRGLLPPAIREWLLVASAQPILVSARPSIRVYFGEGERKRKKFEQVKWEEKNSKPFLIIYFV